jgi:hypothetical protein
MRARTMPPGLLLMVPVVAGFLLYAFTTQDGGAAPGDATATAVAQPATPTPDALLTAIAADHALYEEQTPWEPPAPVFTPVPTPRTAEEHGPFHAGAWVRVNAGAGDCLNARSQPGLLDEWTRILMCLPDGFEGMLTGSASEVDGHWWWSIAGAGFVAEDYLQYVREGDLASLRVPALAGAGRIAFIRSGPRANSGSGTQELWVMDADGSNKRKVAEHAPGPADGWLRVGELSWSPDGAALAYNVWGASGRGAELHLLRFEEDGTVGVRVLRGMMGGTWSPDSRRLGVLFEGGDMSMEGYRGIPGVIDLSGGELRLTAEPVANERPPSFNHDGTLLVASYTQQEGENWRSYRRVFDAATGAVVSDIVLPDDAWFASLRWSPVANQLAGYTSDGTRGIYAVYDLAAGRIVASVPVPPYSPKIGGKCGAPDMMRMAWSRDGRRVLYRFDMGESGDNGIWSWDPATGETSLLRAGYPGYPAAGPDAWFAFAADNLIFVARSVDVFPQIVGEGADPAWWAPPVPAPEASPTPTAAATETPIATAPATETATAERSTTAEATSTVAAATPTATATATP